MNRMRVIYVRYGKDLWTELLDENDVLVRSIRGRVSEKKMIADYRSRQETIKEVQI